MPGAANQAFNTVNRDTFRWRRMWREIGAFFDVDLADCPENPQPLEQQKKDCENVWQDIAAKRDLVEDDVTKLVSWWHSDADMGREQECMNDMTKSRDFGFTNFKETGATFFDLFARLRAKKAIPG